jgi:hypothetical protein
MTRERQYCISSATEHRLERGSMRSTPERPKTSSWSPWANKLARIAWAVLSSGEEYRPLAHGPAA